MNRTLTRLITAAALAAAALPALAQQQVARIGFVSTERIMRDSAVAKRAQSQIQNEFAPRDREMQGVAAQLKTMQEDLQKNAVTMAESERTAKERKFDEMSRDFQRRQREFQEDLGQRRNELMAQVIQKANEVIRKLAEQDKLDIILQDAVYASPRIDITDKVIKTLDAQK
jgi:outer membrane protein